MKRSECRITRHFWTKCHIVRTCASGDQDASLHWVDTSCDKNNEEQVTCSARTTKNEQPIPDVFSHLHLPPEHPASSANRNSHPKLFFSNWQEITNDVTPRAQTKLAQLPPFCESVDKQIKTTKQEWKHPVAWTIFPFHSSQDSNRNEQTSQCHSPQLKFYSDNFFANNNLEHRQR